MLRFSQESELIDLDSERIVKRRDNIYFKAQSCSISDTEPCKIEFLITDGYIQHEIYSSVSKFYTFRVPKKLELDDISLEIIEKDYEYKSQLKYLVKKFLTPNIHDLRLKYSSDSDLKHLSLKYSDFTNSESENLTEFLS